MLKLYFKKLFFTFLFIVGFFLLYFAVTVAWYWLLPCKPLEIVRTYADGTYVCLLSHDI